MAVIETWFVQDLNKPVQVHYLQGNVFTKDNQGNLIGVVVTDGENDAALQGSVSASVIRADGATLSINGTLNGNRCNVVLTRSCYEIPGLLSIVIKLTSGSAVTTLCAVTATVYQSETDAVVDPEHVVPSLSELLAQIENCRSATEDAQTATINANTATSAADTAASNANSKATAANTAASAANTAASTANAAAAKIDGMTVGATGLAAGANPTAAVSDVNGHKHIAFGIPKGDTGATPSLTIGTVSTLNPDQQASATITGTAENPVLNLSIPKGNTGSVSNVYGTTIPISESDSRSIKTVIDTNFANLEDGIAIVANGDTHAAIASGQFVYVKNHSSLADGLYRASAAIGTNATLSTSNLVADGSGGLNALKSDIDAVNSNLMIPQMIIRLDYSATITSVSDFNTLLSNVGLYYIETNASIRQAWLSLGLVPIDLAGYYTARKIGDNYFFLEYTSYSRRKWFTNIDNGNLKTWLEVATK